MIGQKLAHYRITAAIGAGGVGEIHRVVPAFAVLACLLLPAAASGQTDEIQVYDGGLAGPGVFNLTLHDNLVARGLTMPAFEGAVTADRSWNGAAEWAYGATRWFEAGLYLPLFSYDRSLGWGLDGAKLRALFAVPDADGRRFVYGCNLEFSVNARRWDTTRFTSEIRPILGLHLGRIDVILNPILDTAYDGLSKVDFAPSARVAANLRGRWAVALEEYADLGPVGGFAPLRDQSHQLYGVVDFGGTVGVEAGVGVGLTRASDDLTFKLILSRDLNRR